MQRNHCKLFEKKNCEKEMNNKYEIRKKKINFTIVSCIQIEITSNEKKKKKTFQFNLS